MDGLIIINKPKGFTSQDVVSKVKKILNVKKAGHTGTLDPLATGVLPILLGNYTKLSKYLIEHDKTYKATICLGEKRSTGDGEGEIIQTSEIIPDSEENVKEVLMSFLGNQMQVPPIYSAIKVNGKKLYEYARAGENIEIEPRPIEIYKLDFIEYNKNDKIIEFEVSCSKGTYIRALCEDIAKKLGTCGYMKELQRIKVDDFCIDEAYTFEKLEEEKESEEFINSKLVKMEDLFKKYAILHLNKRKLELFLNGVMLTFEVEDGVYNIYSDNKYIGLGIVKNKLLKRDVIL